MLQLVRVLGPHNMVLGLLTMAHHARLLDIPFRPVPRAGQGYRGVVARNAICIKGKIVDFPLVVFHQLLKVLGSFLSLDLRLKGDERAEGINYWQLVLVYAYLWSRNFLLRLSTKVGRLGIERVLNLKMRWLC